MENLTLMEKEALEILKRLERCCESAELHNPGKVEQDKFLQITFNDIDFSLLLKTENIYDIEKYLQKNGVNFTISGNDFLDRFPGMSINKYLPFNNKTQLGIIKGENLQDIKTKIKELIDMLNARKSNEKSVGMPALELKIKYNMNLGHFIFNNGTVKLEGKQKDTADVLVHNGTDNKTSWDAIYEKFKDSDTDQDLPNNKEFDARKRSVRTAVTEINNHTRQYLQPKKDLIDVKNNEYWLQYKVDKGR